MAALNRPKNATYQIHEHVTCDAQGMFCLWFSEEFAHHALLDLLSHIPVLNLLIEFGI